MATFNLVVSNERKQKSNPPRPPPSPNVLLTSGSACDNFRGYCDTFSKCQRIDSQGPFNQLTNMIFDPVTLNKVKDWIVVSVPQATCGSSEAVYELCTFLVYSIRF